MKTKKTIEKFNIKNGELTKLYLKSDIILRTCLFHNFIEISINEFGINPLYCVSLAGFTMQCGTKYTGINLQTLQDEEIILLLKNNICGGISSVMGNRHEKSDENKKILYIDTNNSNGWAMSQPLPFDEIKFGKNVKIEDILNTPDDSGIGYFIEWDFSYPDLKKENTKKFFLSWK